MGHRGAGHGGYAYQVRSLEDQWQEVTPPAALAVDHEAQIAGLDLEAQAYDLIAAKLRDRTYDAINGSDEARDLYDQAGNGYHDWRVAVIDAARDAGVKVPWEWPQ